LFDAGADPLAAAAAAASGASPASAAAVAGALPQHFVPATAGPPPPPPPGQEHPLVAMAQNYERMCADMLSRPPYNTDAILAQQVTDQTTFQCSADIYQHISSHVYYF